MKGFLTSLLFGFMLFYGILSSPTPIRSNADASCPPYSCIVDTSLCFCGVTQTPEDRCCSAKCTACPPDFTVKPWLTFDWSSFDFSTLDLSFLGRK